jgi:BirA family transcriptional regulator, biotin operon repressor / biotin---[acetyl-CoA-carboxylase] ligase
MVDHNEPQSPDTEGPAGHVRRVRAALPSGVDVRWLGECPSTNTMLMDEARSGHTQPALLVADRQTAGRGRLGRSWEAPVGASLAMSIRMRVDTELLGLLPLIVGVSVRDVVMECGLPTDQLELKWPNDLMHPPTGRKYVGILCEAIMGGDVSTVVVGIGINLNRPAHVEGVVAERAAWVSDAVGKEIDLVVVVTEVANRVLSCGKDSLQRDLSQSWLSTVEATLATIGQTVRVEQHDRTWTGTAVGLSATGALRLVEDGHVSETVVHAADVVHLRITTSG